MPNRKKPETSPALDKSRGPRSHSVDQDTPASVRAQNEAQLQINALEHGLRLFREKRWNEAKEYFQRALNGPASAVRFTAQTHINVCERRMQKPTLNLVTADDHYHYGVERLNARDIETARKHFQVALALKPDTEYMLYALAGTLALFGDVAGSFENLRRAIELEPRNRLLARQDPDFASVVHNPLFAHLLQPEKDF